MNPHVLNMILPLLMAAGAVFRYLSERGRVQDEREDLIQLKSYNVSHWATLAVLLLFCFVNLFRIPGPILDAYFLMYAILVATMYGELGAKIYYRWKM